MMQSHQRVKKQKDIAV